MLRWGCLLWQHEFSQRDLQSYKGYDKSESSVSPVIECFFQKEAKEEKHLMIFPRTEEKGPLSARPALELFLKPTLGKCLREGLERILAFPSAIPS